MKPLVYPTDGGVWTIAKSFVYCVCAYTHNNWPCITIFIVLCDLLTDWLVWWRVEIWILNFEFWIGMGGIKDLICEFWIAFEVSEIWMVDCEIWSEVQILKWYLNLNGGCWTLKFCGFGSWSLKWYLDLNGLIWSFEVVFKMGLSWNLKFEECWFDGELKFEIWNLNFGFEWDCGFYLWISDFHLKYWILDGGFWIWSLKREVCSL